MKNATILCALAASFLALGCSQSSDAPAAAPGSEETDDPLGKADSPSLNDKLGIDHGNGTIPVGEVSGLALRSASGQRELIAVGDAEATIAVASLPSSTKPSELSFVRYDVSALVPHSPSQWEAVATDQEGRVFVLEENPGAVYVFSPGLDELLHTYELHVTSSGPDWKKNLDDEWDAEPNSRGEGLVLGSNGHLFVLKEKLAPMIVEFGPAGDDPVGLWAPADSVVVPSSSSSELVPLRVYEFGSSVSKYLPDMSDLFMDSAGSLYVVSGESRTIGRIREWLDPSDDGKLHLEAVWRMPDEIENPEGLILLDDDEPWVASDTPNEVNLYELDRIAH